MTTRDALSSPTSDEQNEMAGIRTIKSKAARTHFLGDVFVAVAVVIA